MVDDVSRQEDARKGADPPGRPPRPNRFQRYRLWLPVVSVLSALVAGEGLCRLFHLAPPRESGFKFLVRQQDNDVEHDYITYDSQTLWKLVPGYHSPGVPEDAVHVNSMGLRDREYSVEKPADVYRILCLGDSTTFGFFVNGRSAYQNVLEDLLNTSGEFGATRFEVINAGVPGYSTFQCLRYLQVRGLRFSPDLVVLFVGPNDVKDSSLPDAELAALAPATAVARLNDALSQLACFRALRSLIRKPAPESTAHHVPRVGLQGCAENILAIHRQCQSAGAGLVVIPFPYCTPFPPEFPRELEPRYVALRQITIRTAREQKIPLVGLPAMEQQAGGNHEDYFIDLVHPSELGHRYIAEQLYETLLNARLLPGYEQHAPPGRAHATKT